MQLLEDYKHGTLRPGVTNEQVTAGGRAGKEGGKFTAIPCSQNPFSSLQHPLLLLLRALWTCGSLEEILRSLLYPGSGGKHGG